MNRNIRIAILLLLSLQVLGLEAQEYWGPLSGNPVLEPGWKKAESHFKTTAATDTLELPFLDDFTSAGGQPSPELWTASDAWVNHSFPINPPSIGVATLDALDANGSIHAEASSYPYEADELSSLPIKLNYPASDSIYLSFFFQSAGLGEEPEEGDSLLLDFWACADSSWQTVWGSPGMLPSDFEQVLIPVSDTAYLKEGFRFRFRNLASIASSINGNEDRRGNVDHWNIDYVRLDRMRSASDTILHDVAFTSVIGRVLLDYSTLPWTHLGEAYNTMQDNTLSLSYANHDDVSRNVGRHLLLEEPWYGISIDQGTATHRDLPAGQETVVDLEWFYPGIDLSGDSGLVRFKAALRTDEYDNKSNDTLIHDQFFGSSFAYDDGTAETGYGLRGSGTSDGKVAQKFNAFIPDRIGGVDLCFNQLADSANLGYYFELMVWADQDGKPGAVLYESREEFLVQYPSSHPGFVRYHFTEAVDVNGVFYVGWKQYNQYRLEVGLDLNSPLSSSVLYSNFTGVWNPSGAPGPILIRPFLYDETTSIGPAYGVSRELNIWPNPASDLLYLDLPPEESRALVSLYDISGRLSLQTEIRENQLNISTLPGGIYFLHLQSGNSRYYSKLLILHQ